MPKSGLAMLSGGADAVAFSRDPRIRRVLSRETVVFRKPGELRTR